MLIFSYQKNVSLLVVYGKEIATTAALSTDEDVVLSVTETVFMVDFVLFWSSSANDLIENRRVGGIFFFFFFGGVLACIPFLRFDS